MVVLILCVCVFLLCLLVFDWFAVLRWVFVRFLLFDLCALSCLLPGLFFVFVC